MKLYVISSILILATLIKEGYGYGREYRTRQRQPKVRPPTLPIQPRFEIPKRPQPYPIQPRIDNPRQPSSSHNQPTYDQEHNTYSSQTPYRGDLGGKSSHIVDLSLNPGSKQTHQTPLVGVPPIVRTIDLPDPHQTSFGHTDDIHTLGYSEGKSSNRKGRHDYELPVETTGYTTVFNVNGLQGGTCKPNELWKVDCNEEIEHRAITAIWDDRNNFKDLDKVKCGIVDESTTLDLHDAKVIDFDQTCPSNYVLTAVFDKFTGFPSVSNGKCTRVANRKLDNTNHIVMSTDNQDNGPSAPLANWKVQCPYSSAAVGIIKEKGTIVALICANLSEYNSYDEHVTIKRH